QQSRKCARILASKPISFPRSRVGTQWLDAPASRQGSMGTRISCMPIRFRCAYCNQLMGIARRKAGTVVKCPKCAGEIIVPVPEGDEPAAESTDQAGGDVPTFNPSGTEPVDAGATATAEPPSAPLPFPPPAPPQRIGVF